MRDMNRRAVLAGAATLPALTLPAIAANEPDAELLAIGRQYDALVLVYEDARRRSEPWIAAQQRVLSGLSKRPHTDAETMAALEQVEREFPVAFPDCDDAMDATYAPACRIMALPATTIAGLAVKARLAKFSAFQLWETAEEDQDWDKLAVRKLIDSILENVEAA